MKCKKCNYELEKGWKICPMCSEPIKIKKTKRLMEISIVIVLILLFLIINIDWGDIFPEQRIKTYLKNTYNKSFDSVRLVTSIENPDFDLSCDGSSCGTIEGKGNTEYYLVYSKSDDIEFTVSYDTDTKKYIDTYETHLNLKRSVMEFYGKLNNTFGDYIDKIEFLYDINNDNAKSIIITSSKELDSILSKVSDNYLDNTKSIDNPSTGLYMHVNMNSLDFCKKEYKNIKEIGEYLKILQSQNELYSKISLTIYASDRVKIVFDTMKGILIYDQYSVDKIWGEKIEDFINRDSY